MAWKTKNNRRYYYHLINDHGKIRSIYVPSALAGEYERATQSHKAARLERRQALENVRSEILTKEQPIVDYHNELTLIYSQFKVSTGYYKHRGVVWRKKDPIYRRREA